MKILLSIFCLGLLSCSSEKSEQLAKTDKQYDHFLINMQHYFSDEELNMSFPIWFDDSIVKGNKIKSITRNIYFSATKDNEDLSSPIEVKHYHFDENGQIISIDIDHYYENIKISSLSFVYKTQKDENGFALVDKLINSQSHKDDNEDLYRIYEKEQYADKYLVYKDEKRGDYLFYMLQKDSWGGLSIDSILAPTPDDFIVLGHPHFPSKLYQVRNTVNEFHVSQYEYDKTGLFVKGITFDSYPFHYKRSINYNSKGLVTGFIDSTFSDDKYVTRRVSEFTFLNSLPSELVHIKRQGSTSEKYYQREKLAYSFYD